MAKQSVK